jgi:antitoxin MazE
MRAQVKKWGNSASVRIPASVMAAAAIEVDQLVDIREDNGRIVIEPLRAPVYDLDFPEDADFGAPVGNETW